MATSIEVTSPSMVSPLQPRAGTSDRQAHGRCRNFTSTFPGIRRRSATSSAMNDYLNPNGSNRQFILLTVEQKTAPLLNARFSTSRKILRRFIDENEEQLFALSIRDCIVGELINSVYSLRSPRDLFDIRTIEIEADTVGRPRRGRRGSRGPDRTLHERAGRLVGRRSHRRDDRAVQTDRRHHPHAAHAAKCPLRAAATSTPRITAGFMCSGT